MSYANAIRTRTRGATAWNFTDEERRNIVRKSANQYGTRYDFSDGSVGFVDKGSSAFLLYVGAPKGKRRGLAR